MATPTISDDLAIRFAERLSGFVKKKGWSQGTAAEFFGVSKSNLGNWLRLVGKPSIKNYNKAIALINEAEQEEVLGVRKEENTPPPRGILDDLDDARKSLDRAIKDIDRAAQTAVPLIRPGLRELVTKLREARKMLEL